MAFAIRKNLKAVLALLLAACLVVSLFSYVALAAGEPEEISAYERTNPVYEAEVDPGTARRDLGLPDTLRALVDLDEETLENMTFIQAEPDPDTAYVWLPDTVLDEDAADGTAAWRQPGEDEVYTDGDYIAPADALNCYEAGEDVVYLVYRDADEASGDEYVPEYRAYGSIDGGEEYHWFAVDTNGCIYAEVLDAAVKWSGTYNPKTSDTYTLTAEASGYSYEGAAPYARITVTGDEKEEFENAIVPLKAVGNIATLAEVNSDGSYTVTVGETFLLEGSSYSNASGLNVYYAYTQMDSLPTSGSTAMLVSEYGGSYYFAQPVGGEDVWGTQGLYAESENVTYTDGGGNLYLGSLDISSDLWYVTRSGNTGNYNYQFADSSNHSSYMNGAYNWQSSDSGITFGQVSMGSSTNFTISDADDGNYYVRFTASPSWSTSTSANFYLYYYPHDDVHVRAQDSLDLEYGGSTTWNFYQRNGFLVQALTTGDKTITVDGQTITIHVEPVETVQPSNVTVNLFDYWLTTQDADDTEDNLTGGINSMGNNFKFAKGGTSYYGYWNQYDGNDSSGGHNPYLGIVSRTLTDGYPTFSGLSDTGLNPATDTTTTYNLGAGSLAYLFDPSTSNGYRAVYQNVTNLFQLDEDGYYWYDSDRNYAQFNENTGEDRDESAGSFTLYGASQLGFFPFTTFEDATKITTVESGELNHYFGMTLTSNFRQMYDGCTNAQQDVETIFEFSGDDDVWIFIDDVLVADLGGVHQEVSVRINFATGYIYVNCDENTPLNQLEKYENNSSWQKRDHDSYYTTIYDMFSYAGAVGSSDKWTYNEDSGTYIFANLTTHNLEFFYMERGHNYSNLEITTNLIDVPETTVYKVDENGNALGGAEFAVYTAKETSEGSGVWCYETAAGGTISPEDLTAGLSDGTYDYDLSTGNIIYSGSGTVFIEAKYCDVTDEDGKFNFYYDKFGTYYTLEDILDVFGERFFLREIMSPTGYRMVSEDALLYVTTDATAWLLVCDETYDTGIWAAPRIRVLASNKLYLADEDRVVSYYDRETGDINGSLFAVVLKYEGPSPATDEDLSDPDNWAAVWGNDTIGHTLVDPADYGGGADGLREAILVAAAHQQELNQDPLFFEEDKEMEATLSFLPGDITKYYHMLRDADKDKTEFALAYYWTGETVTDLSELSASDIHRVDETASGYTFTLEYAATVEVADTMNRLYVEKEDEETGDLVENAYFGLYEVREEPDGIYYVGNTRSDGSGNEVLVDLAEDTNGDNIGRAELQSGAEGTYVVSGAVEDNNGTLEVPEDLGLITVTIGTSVYYIIPADCRNTIPAGASYREHDHDDYEIMNDTGETAAIFQDLEDGNYLVREIWAPLPYLLNTTEIKVKVTDEEIYANAGTLDDGVTVARGSGYLISTMHEAASLGDINRTLSWIYLMLRVDNNDNDTYDFESTVQNACFATDRYGSLTETNTSYEDGMRAYLIYAGEETGTMFNFIMDEDALSLAHNTGTRRLYTDVGWSYLEIYQNPYKYIEAGGADGVHYEYEEFFVESTDSEGNTIYIPTRDLNSLYTRSVYIRVTDPEINADVELVKLDGTNYETDNSGSDYNVTELTPLAGAQFILSKTVTELGDEVANPDYDPDDPDSEPYIREEIKVTYYYQETEATDVDEFGNEFTFTKVVWTTDADDATIIESKSPTGVVMDGRVLLQQLEEGEYTLTEIRAPDGYTLPASPKWTITVKYDETTGSLTYEADTGIWTGSPENFILLPKEENSDRYVVVEVWWDNTVSPERYAYTDPISGQKVNVYLNEDDGLLYRTRTLTGYDTRGNPVYEYEDPVAELMYATTYYIPNTNYFTLYKIDGSDAARDSDGNVTGFTAVEGASFILSTTVTVEDGSGGLEERTVYYAYDEADQTVEWVEDKDSATVIRSGEDGQIVLPTLGAGTYRLQEVTAPAGYMVMASPWTIVVTETGEIRVDRDDYTTASPGTFIFMADESYEDDNRDDTTRYSVVKITQSTDDEWVWTYETGNGETGELYQNPADGLLYTVYTDGEYSGISYELMRPTVWYIPNYRTYELPSADGEGPPLIWYLAGGAAMLLAGGCMLWLRFRRRGEVDLN